MGGIRQWLADYGRKLSVLYGTRYGRISAAVATVVVLVGSAFPIVLLVYFIAVTVMIMLPDRKSGSLACFEALERLGDVKEVTSGLLYWLPFPPLIAFGLMNIIDGFDLHAHMTIETLGVFNNQFGFFCDLARTNAKMVNIEPKDFHIVAVANFLAIEWLLVANLCFSFMLRQSLHANFPSDKRISFYLFMAMFFCAFLLSIIYVSYELGIICGTFCVPYEISIYQKLGEDMSNYVLSISFWFLIWACFIFLISLSFYYIFFGICREIFRLARERRA